MVAAEALRQAVAGDEDGVSWVVLLLPQKKEDLVNLPEIYASPYCTGEPSN